MVLETKVTSTFFSTICFSLIFTREIFSRKPNINFYLSSPSTLSQLQTTDPELREVFLPHCLMGPCQHFCLTVLLAEVLITQTVLLPQ